MDLDKIITEEIEKLITLNAVNEHISLKNSVNEDSNSENNKNSHLGQKMKKLKGGLRTNFDIEADKISNPDLNTQDANDIISKLNNGYVNIAKVARAVYPDHTPEGAQSQLRKKIKRLKSDSGTPYKLKEKEAKKLYKIISNMER